MTSFLGIWEFFQLRLICILRWSGCHAKDIIVMGLMPIHSLHLHHLNHQVKLRHPGHLLIDWHHRVFENQSSFSTQVYQVLCLSCTFIGFLPGWRRAVRLWPTLNSSIMWADKSNQSLDTFPSSYLWYFIPAQHCKYGTASTLLTWKVLIIVIFFHLSLIIRNNLRQKLMRPGENVVFLQEKGRKRKSW